MSIHAQVVMNNSGIVLYGHSIGDDIYRIVQKALNNKERWEDEKYLARIIFDEMKKKSNDTFKGFGIGTDIDYNIKNTIYINCKIQQVELPGRIFIYFEIFCDNIEISRKK